MPRSPPIILNVEICNRERGSMTLEEAGEESPLILATARRYFKATHPDIDNVNLGIHFVREGGRTIGKIFSFDEDFAPRDVDDDLFYVPD